MTYGDFSYKFAEIGGYNPDSVHEFVLMLASEDDTFINVSDSEMLFGVVRPDGTAIQAFRLEICNGRSKAVISPEHVFDEASACGVSAYKVSPFLKYMSKYVAWPGKNDDEFVLSTTKMLKNKGEVLMAVRHFRSDVG